MKTSELTGAALDWAVAKCEGLYWEFEYRPDGPLPPRYSTDWSQGGPIIEREKIELRHANTGRYASYFDGSTWFGPTPLIAAMRCFVSSRLGDEVEVPDELSPTDGKITLNPDAVWPFRSGGI